MSPQTQAHRFTIASTFDEVSDLAELAGRLCVRAGARGLADSLRLCLAEALNNVVEHAYSGDRGQLIDVTLNLGRNGFDVIVTDSGVRMPGDAPPLVEPAPESAEPEQLPEGGFGWMLIRSEVDRLDYKRRGGCNILTMGKTIDA